MPQSQPPQLAGTPLFGSNAPYVEDLYERFLRDPQSVDASWRAFFAQLPASGRPEQAHGPIIAAIASRTQASAARPRATGAAGTTAGAASEKQAAVSRLMQIYANRGHLIARIDPLGMLQRPRPKVLSAEYAGLTEADMDCEFVTGARNDWIGRRASLREILARLERIYCGSIGAEFAHVSNSDERLWLQDEFQLGRMQQSFSAEEQRGMLAEIACDRARRDERVVVG